MDIAPRPRPRWLFRGRPGAWDVLTETIATDPTRSVPWPIAPSGPSMQIGDTVLLWRSGRGGGVAALCTVVGEPEAQPRPGGPPEVTVDLRIERALGRPIAPETLVADPVLRPLAFMDLFATTEHRVTQPQEQALAALFAAHERTGTTDAGPADHGTRIAIDVPIALVPVVRELLAALGADEPPSEGPTRTSAVGPLETPGEPTDLQVEQALELAQRHGDDTFTVDEAAATWRTGVGTARSRVERLLDAGLMQRAGTLRAEERPGVRPTRGRPPVLYRLAERGASTH